MDNGRKWTNGQCELNLGNATWPASWNSNITTATNDRTSVGASFQFVQNSTSLNSTFALDRGRNGRVALLIAA